MLQAALYARVSTKGKGQDTATQLAQPFGSIAPASPGPLSRSLSITDPPSLAIA